MDIYERLRASARWRFNSARLASTCYFEAFKVSETKPSRSLRKLLLAHSFGAVKNGRPRPTDQKPLRVFARVPRAKICAFQQASDDPTFSDEGIAKILAIRPAENRLCQLRAYWTGISCLETPPVELKEREPDFEEREGVELWTIKQKAG